MKSELILSDDGGVIFIQDRPYQQKVIRVEFYLDSGYMILIYQDETSRMVEYQFQDKSVVEAIRHASTIILSHMNDDKLQDGFEVPLIAIRP